MSIFVSYIAQKTVKIIRYITIVVLAAATVSCTFLHDDQLVARVGRNKLYRSEVVKYIPAGLPESDSLALAQQYIKAWAGELIINEMASKQLSKSEMDVSRELQEYKSSLLKYRYEQHYIADRLDTVVTDDQILAHYQANPSLYTLSIPVAKASYLRIPNTSPMKEQLRELMASQDPYDVYMLDSLSYSNANKFTRFGDGWVDMITLARDFGTDYETLVDSIKDSYIDIVDQQGVEHIAYLESYVPSGTVPPVEYCKDKVRDVIISQRKYALSSNLEQDLLDNAIKQGNFVIYEDNEQ